MKSIHATRIFCMALAALMLSLILIQAGFAAIGVKEGDWAKYKIEAVVDVPEEMEGMVGEIEEMEWLKVEVQSISDTTVTVEEIIYYKDGTNETETIEDAMESGSIIEADLGEGDEVPSAFFAPDMTVYINGTVSRTYAGASREVNYVEITREGYPVTFMTSTMKAYWDKATGSICEMSISMSGEYEGVTAEVYMSYKMTETNMWEAEVAPFGMEWWFWAIIAGIIIVAAVSAVVLLRRRKAPLPEVAPAPTE